MLSIGKSLIDLNFRFLRRPLREIMAVCLACVLVVGFADYATGVYVSLSVFYAIPIGWAAWSVSRRYAYLLALISSVVWVAGNMMKGFPGSDTLVPLWNVSIRLMFYALFIEVLCRLRDLQSELEMRVEDRTAALRGEVAERRRLEQELMEVGERERRRIGQDLHDSLCQHLTGTALVGEALSGRLTGAEAKEARKVVDLVEEGISLARRLAKGLHPVADEPAGLMHALEEFAETTSRAFKVSCVFECESPVLVSPASSANHMFRIAQEAVSNAIKHGPASRIVISLEVSEGGVCLAVCDNGAGIALKRPASGMGLEIMADRAKLIGGALTVERIAQGGTRVACVVPSGGGIIHD